MCIDIYIYRDIDIDIDILYTLLLILSIYGSLWIIGLQFMAMTQSTV